MFDPLLDLNFAIVGLAFVMNNGRLGETFYVSLAVVIVLRLYKLSY
jgi:hypothetical protein